MKKLPKSVKKQLLNLTFVVVLIAITITVLIVNFKEDGLSFENIGAFFGSANPYFIVAAFGCMVLFILFEAMALFLIVRKLGHKSKFYQSIAYAASDSYYSAITPSATGGQPASAFYMARDGMGAGKASFALVVNLVGHSFAIVFSGVMALILRPHMFSEIGVVFPQALIIFGAVIQVLLLGLFIACMFFGKVILKIGNWLIRVLTKIRIIKKPEKWHKKLEQEVEKFRSCRADLKNHPSAIIEALIFNVLQRTAQFLIPVFICLSVKPDSDPVTLFSAQVLVFYGYSCVPIPGGVGAYELMYYNIYSLHPGYDNSFILVAMMISRVIQYYICMLVTGVYTWVYHIVGVKEGRIKADEGVGDDEDEDESETPGSEAEAASENADADGPPQIETDADDPGGGTVLETATETAEQT